MITVVKLINIHSPHIVILLCVCVIRVPEIYCLSKLALLSTLLLTILIMLYIRSLNMSILNNYNSVLTD